MQLAWPILDLLQKNNLLVSNGNGVYTIYNIYIYVYIYRYIHIHAHIPMYGKINTYSKVPIRVVSPFTKYTTHPKYLNWVLNMCKSRSKLWFITGCFIFGGWGYIPISYHWLVYIYNVGYWLVWGYTIVSRDSEIIVYLWNCLRGTLLFPQDFGVMFFFIFLIFLVFNCFFNFLINYNNYVWNQLNINWNQFIYFFWFYTIVYPTPWFFHTILYPGFVWGGALH